MTDRDWDEIERLVREYNAKLDEAKALRSQLAEAVDTDKWDPGRSDYIDRIRFCVDDIKGAHGFWLEEEEVQ